MTFDFDTPIERRGTNSAKWDTLDALLPAKPKDPLSMWVADMDFLAPPCVTAALQAEVDHGIYGYYADDRAYHSAITGWMARRHDWMVKPEWIATTHGLVAGLALCLQAFSAPGDAVIIFTPVYHVFARMIKANGRVVTEAPMPIKDGQYAMDFDDLANRLTGAETMVIFCSPHNPGGRVWSVSELRALADFCVKHDLILVSDEIHHDLVFKGSRHVVMPNAAPEIADRLVMMTAASKTFSLAGGMSGSVIISDPVLRARFAAVQGAAGASPNRFGKIMTTAAYAEGEEWLEAVLVYLDENRRIFDAGMTAIPGVTSMQLEGTYLAWINFEGTGMDSPEFIRRIEEGARIATSHGASFGTGGESYIRFNLAASRSVIEDAVTRLQTAFADLQ